jgi:hypothetical protein
MSLKNLLEKLENLTNCTLANCSAESIAFTKPYKKATDPIIKKLKILGKNKPKNAEKIAELLKQLKEINYEFANNKDLVEPPLYKGTQGEFSCVNKCS